jgi:transcription-repair coupling factor (superfamily II helicase)
MRALTNLRVRASELGLTRAVRDRLVEKMSGHLIASVNPLFFPLFYEEVSLPDTFFSFLPPETTLILDDPVATARALERMENDMSRFLLKARAEGRFYLEGISACLSAGELEGHLEAFPRVVLDELVLGVGEGEGERYDVEADLGIRPGQRPRDWGETGLLAPLAEKIAAWLRQRYWVALVCAGDEEGKRLTHLMEGYGFQVEQAPAGGAFLDRLPGVRERGRLILCEGWISGGFVWHERGLVLIAEADIFGKKVARRPVRPAREGYFLRSFGELREGDYVVHKDHGIGRYRGLQKIRVEGVENDFLLMEYAEGDKLYIPVDRLDRIQRYIGPEGFTPRVERLGGTSWEALKEKVKKSIQEVAEELVAIYAAREVMERSAFAPPDRLYEEFASRFEFEETPDQARPSRTSTPIWAGPSPWIASSAATRDSARRRWPSGPPSGPSWRPSRWQSSYRRPSWRSSTTRPSGTVFRTTPSGSRS